MSPPDETPTEDVEEEEETLPRGRAGGAAARLSGRPGASGARARGRAVDDGKNSVLNMHVAGPRPT